MCLACDAKNKRDGSFCFLDRHTYKLNQHYINDIVMWYLYKGSYKSGDTIEIMT